MRGQCLPAGIAGFRLEKKRTASDLVGSAWLSHICTWVLKPHIPPMYMICMAGVARLNDRLLELHIAAMHTALALRRLNEGPQCPAPETRATREGESVRAKEYRKSAPAHA